MSPGERKRERGERFKFSLFPASARFYPARLWEASAEERVPSGRLFTVSSEDEWRIYQDFMLEDNANEYELVGEFSKFLY